MHYFGSYGNHKIVVKAKCGIAGYLEFRIDLNWYSLIRV
jgi:hypothetical protein